MSALAPLLVSAALAALIAPRALRVLPRRPNWRGLALPFPAGVIALAAGGAAAAILAAAGRPPDAAVLVLGAGVALLGAWWPPLSAIYDWSWFVGFGLAGVTYYAMMQPGSARARRRR